MVPGAGEGDVDGAEAEEGICGDSGVLVPAVVSATFEKIQNRALGSNFPRDVGDSKRFRLCAQLIWVCTSEKAKKQGGRHAVTSAFMLISRHWR